MEDERENAVDESEEAAFDEIDKPIIDQSSPRWLKELHQSPYRTGFYQSLDDHAVLFVDRGTSKLVVSFDNLSSVRDGPLNRDPWGYSFIQKNSWSHLGVLAFKPSWFRDKSLFDALTQLAGNGFFNRFSNITFTGTSMGGYAACAFSSLAPRSKVVAYSPQSTLAKSIVPWEKRFSSGRKADWTGRFVDAAAEAKQAREVWLFHDPRVEDDRRHIERFTGENIRPLRMRNAGHKTAYILRRAGHLAQTTKAVVEDKMSESAFYALYRENRGQPWFVQANAARAATKGRFNLIEQMAKFMEQNGHGGVARKLRRDYLSFLSQSPLLT